MMTREIFRNTLLGGAIGDALGYHIEFQRAAAIAIDHPKVPSNLSALGEVHFTDDTQMTLFMAESLNYALRGGGNVVDEAVGGLKRWYLTQIGGKPPENCTDHNLLDVQGMWASRAPGATCMSSCSRLSRGEVFSTQNVPNNSKGCGAIMRSAPYGLAATLPEEAFGWARDCAVLTHGHPSGYYSAAALAVIINELTYATNIREAIASAVVQLNATGSMLAMETLNAIENAALAAHDNGYLPDAAHVDTIHKLGGGWVGEEALSIALYCALTANIDTEMGTAHALWNAVAHNGDSDSTGAICGNILGAMGAPLPQAWVNEIEMPRVLLGAADALYTATTGRKA